MSKFHRILKIGLIQVVILFFLLILLILVIELRFYYKYKIKYPPNDFVTITWGHKVKNNKWGFRERDYNISAIKKADCFLIAVLGDSLTWGAGLTESQRYSNLLEGYLQSEYPNKKIIVMNFGIPSGPTTKEQSIYKSIYKEFKPNLTILGFCFNDPQEKQQHYSKEREIFFEKVDPVVSFLNRYHMKGTAKLIPTVYENILIAFKKIPHWTVALDRVYNVNSLEWNRFLKALEAIVQMSGEIAPNPPIFISLNQGVSNRVPTDYNNPDERLQLYIKWYHQAEFAANQAGFIAINCENEFKNLNNHIMAVIPNEDIHPSAKMNEIYARKLFSIIKEKGFVNK